VGHSVIDAQAVGRFMPPVFRGAQADTLAGLARQLGLPEAAFLLTVAEFNAACRVGHFDHAVLDDCHTEGLLPAKTHWARPLTTPPFYGYTLKPGVTFTYLGMKVDEHAAVHFGGRPSGNLYAAGEMMAGNVLGQGYTAGVGMTIGTVFGRIAGTAAAAAAMKGEQRAAA
jgi:tricarballylate dehydrogenase